MNLGAVILAAGFSSRMGAFKPLLTLGKTTVLEHVAQTFIHAEITPIVVTGYKHAEIEALAQSINIQTLHNPRFEEGMFTSIQTGLDHMANAGYAGVFLLPTDIPLVRSGTLSFMQADFAQNSGSCRLWQPVFNGRRGHPPLLRRDLAQSIAALPPNLNLREALNGVLPEHKREVTVYDRYILRDMDYPGDYVDMLAEYENYDVLYPSEAWALLLKYRGDEPKLLRHSLKVMQVALNLALALKHKGANINVRLVQSSALLHDVGKGRDNHACFAAELLAGLELPRMGYVAGCHSGFLLSQGLCDYLGEDVLAAKVVFIADKFVSGQSGDTLVTVDQRFANASARFGQNPEAARRIERLHNEAKATCAEISALLGRPIEEFVLGGGNGGQDV